MTVQKFDAEFQRRIAADKQLAAIRLKIKAGTATFQDTAAYNERVSNLLGEMLSAHINGIPHGSRKSLCEWLLRNQYTDTNEMLATVQRALDEAQGLHLAPQKAPFPEERVQQVAQSLEDTTVPEETIQRRANAPVANVSKSFHDAYMKENAKFRSSAGLKCYIVRNGGAKCCDWCAEVSGKFVYGEEPDDVFRRHDNCHCTVIYDTTRTQQILQGTIGEDGKTTKTWEVVDEVQRGFEPTVFTDETRPAGFSPTVLTGGQRPAIIKLPDIQIGRSIGAKARNYDIMDLSSGEIFHLVEGSRLQNVQVFAGKGTRTVFRDAARYAERYGGDSADWQHVKGFGFVDFYGDERSAELHWVQCEGIGKHEFFVKRWLD